MADELKGSGITMGRVILREELEENAAMYAQWIKGAGLPGDIAFVLVLAPKGHEEMGVTATNLDDPNAAQRVLEKAAKRITRARIVRPT